MPLVTVLAPTTVESLSTTATLREVLGTTSTESDTAQANALKRATAWAESYIGRPIRLQTYQEIVAGYGDFHLLLARRPIHAVLRVFRGTSTDTAQEYLSTEYRINAPTGRLYSRDGFEWTVLHGMGPTGGLALDPYMPPPIPQSEVLNFLVEYSAGWLGDDGTTSTAYGATSTERTLPQDVELGILAKAGEWMTFGAAGGPHVVSKSVGDLALSYGGGSGSGSSSAGWNNPESLLNPYRSIA